MPLKSLCKARLGYSFRQKPDFDPHAETLVIQPKDISADGVLSIDYACRVALSAANPLTPGDVLFINRSRFTACVFEGSIKAPCVATSAFLIFTPKDPSQLLPEYLALFFNSAEGQNLFKRLTMTTTIPFISLGHLESIEIPLPSIERQKALATFGELNKAYLRLSSRKAELQKQIIDQQIARATPV
ncbi:MAG: restriction endonuclease subunit S, partial [Kiritimatiellae bacterium]|nr:restriction endonuclease subunit S [Kiritimatiellia bacterium]